MKSLKHLVVAALTFAATTAHAVEVVFERDDNLPLVYINLAVKAGAVNDPLHQLGITNFMGEMLLRGTKSRTKEQIDLELDQMGARLDVETRSEAMILRGAVLASQLEPFLKLISDIVVQPSFPENEIRKLKSEVISGILEELGRDPSLAGRKFNQFLFRDHPYGKPVLGTRTDVERLTRAQIMDQYNRLMREKLLLVVGTGMTDEKKILDWAATLGKARPGGDGVIEVATPENPPMRRLQIVDKPERTQTQIHAGQIGLRMTDSDFFPLFLANHAFGGGSFSARMMVEIRVKRGWSYGAYSYFKHGLKPRSWQMHLFPASKDTAQALAYSLQMLEDYRNSGISAEEYDFAQKSLVNGAGFMYNTPQKRVENTLLERTLRLPDGFMKSYGPELRKVTHTQANESVKKFYHPDKLSITVLATAKDMKEPLAKAAGVAVDKVVVTTYTQE